MGVSGAGAKAASESARKVLRHSTNITCESHTGASGRYHARPRCLHPLLATSPAIPPPRKRARRRTTDQHQTGRDENRRHEVVTRLQRTHTTHESDSLVPIHARHLITVRDRSTLLRNTYGVPGGVEEHDAWKIKVHLAQLGGLCYIYTTIWYLSYSCTTN